jgi:hypothetical protein
MARYIDADKLIAEYDRVHIGAPGGARKLMVDAPTCNVAPKSEVAREIFEDLEMYVEEHNGCSVNLSRCEFAELKKKYTEAKSDE